MNFSSDLIKFEDYVKKLLNSLWIRPVFTIIPLNSILFHQIGKFGIIFDAIPREIDDLAVSSRHWVKGARGEFARATCEFGRRESARAGRTRGFGWIFREVFK